MGRLADREIHENTTDVLRGIFVNSAIGLALNKTAKAVNKRPHI